MSSVIEKFIGEADMRMCSHCYRDMIMLADFSYHDADDKVWRVYKGDVTDGASIPRWAWVTTGSPFVGRYRRAALLHDSAYRHQQGTRLECDRMFLRAMRLDGVGFIQRWKMYGAVRIGGGRSYRKCKERLASASAHPHEPDAACGA